MLIISPFANIMSAPSAKRASWCNLYAITHASKIMIGHLTAGGMLSCLLAEAGDEKEITIMMA